MKFFTGRWKVDKDTGELVLRWKMRKKKHTLVKPKTSSGISECDCDLQSTHLRHSCGRP